MKTLRTLAALSVLSVGLTACADGPTAPQSLTSVRASREPQPGDDRRVAGKDDPTIHFNREAQPADDRGGRRKDDPTLHFNRQVQPGDDRGAREVQVGDQRRGRGADDAAPHM